MKKHRGILVLTAATLAVALGVSVTAAVQLLRYRLPNPEHANRNELIRWLVVRDLGNESLDTQRALAARLEEEFSEQIDWQSAAEQLSEPQRERLWQNVLVVLEPWFSDKVDGYIELPPAERASYVDRLLDTVVAWSEIESLRLSENPRETGSIAGRDGSSGEPRADTKSSGTSAGLLAVLSEKTEQWKRRADPNRRKQMNQFILAVQFRWLARKFSPASTVRR